MREPPNIPEERLRACLQEEYDLTPVRLEFLPRGLDYSAGLYRVSSDQGTRYLLKITTRPFYEPACLVPHYLREKGITSVVASVPTKSQALWAKLMNWTAILYPYIEGDTGWTGMTEEQWKEVGAIFKRIHGVLLPQDGFQSLRQETFDPTVYADWVRTFQGQHLISQQGESIAERALHASWVAHQSTIDTAVTALVKLAAVLESRSLSRVLCHADLHPANLLRDPAGHVFVIDWDEVMLAPPERDFIFIRGPQADGFWKGYGAGDIDWTALTYFLWERVVQDFIEYARCVCFREDLSEETKADLAQMFESSLTTENNNLNAAYAAAARLNRGL